MSIQTGLVGEGSRVRDRTVAGVEVSSTLDDTHFLLFDNKIKMKETNDYSNKEETYF